MQVVGERLLVADRLELAVDLDRTVVDPSKVNVDAPAAEESQDETVPIEVK